MHGDHSEDMKEDIWKLMMIEQLTRIGIQIEEKKYFNLRLQPQDMFLVDNLTVAFADFRDASIVQGER